MILSFSNLLHLVWSSLVASMLLQMTLFHLFLWLSSISSHTHTHTHTRIYHIFFTYSSVDGHLSSFQVLPVVNSAAMNIWVHVSLWIILLSEYICPVVGLVDHMIILFLVFWGPSLLFSIVTAPTYIPANGVGGFAFLHILSNICYL